MTLTSRDFKKGDEIAILKLFEHSFQRSMDVSYWQWRYQNNILNKYMIRLAEDNQCIAAHYAVSPTEIFINGQQYNSAISMTTMTHPSYRGLGLFTKLANELYENYYEELDIIYGVPNDNSIKGFTKYLKFDHIIDIKVMELDLKKDLFLTSEDCCEIGRFDSRFDVLFEKIRTKYAIILSRSSKYLNWRFFENPVNSYRVIAYTRKGDLLGYAVTKTFKSNELLIGDLVDIIALDTRAFSNLVNSICQDFKEKGVACVKTWMNDKKYNEELDRIGFKKTDESFHFIVRANTDKVPTNIKDFNQWYITMSDIDIF